MLVPLLWAGVIWGAWKLREADRAIAPLALMALAAFIGSVVMLYSRVPADTTAIIAHPSRIAGYLALLFSLMHMASRDMLERIQAQAALADANADLERRVAARTAELSRANARAEAQLERLALLHQNQPRHRRTPGPRQHIPGRGAQRRGAACPPISSVFASITPPTTLEVAAFGAKSALWRFRSAGRSRARRGRREWSFPLRQGALVYEPDISKIRFPFPQRLARGGLGPSSLRRCRWRASVFGALIVARTGAREFRAAATANSCAS